jgi:hypothetical protein
MAVSFVAWAAPGRRRAGSGGTLSTFLSARFRSSANQFLKTGKHAAAAPFSMA